MRFAYHWTYGSAGTWIAEEGAWFKALLAATSARGHVLVRKGGLLTSQFPAESTRRRTLVTSLLGQDLGMWTSFSVESFSALADADPLFLIVASGLTRSEGLAVHRALLPSHNYCGVVEVDLRIPTQWALYHHLLYDAYRLVGDELRIRQDGATEEVNDGWSGDFDHWTSSGLFDNVTRESIGIRNSVLDQFDSPEMAARVGDVVARASDRLLRIADDVVIRIFDLDPRLVDSLHAALRSADTAATGEELAQAALSVRRFLERLADVLFPPQSAKHDGRKVGPAEYKNRLWAYAKESIGRGTADTVDALLKDLGTRIDSAINNANAGLHKPTVQRDEVDRLISDLITTTHDLLVLRPPPIRLPDDAYAEGIADILRTMLQTDNQDTPGTLPS